jgi:putative ABC transport system permease protein
MNSLLQDIRGALRVLVRNPALTITIVVLLAFGIGVNTAIFSFVRGVLLRPLPFPEPEQLIVVNESNPGKGMPRFVVSPRNLEDWEKQSQTIERFGAFRDWHFSLITPEGPEGISSAVASPGLFDVLRVRPVLGRVFRPEDDQPGRNQVIVISNRLWKSRFGGDRGAIGSSLNLDDSNYLVIGVLPPELDSLWLGGFDVWAPLSVDPDQNLARHHRNRQVYARLAQGATIEQARSEMTGIAAGLEKEYPDQNGGWGVVIGPLLEREVGSVKPALVTFSAAVGLVLLIACANIANLLLAGATKRRREFAIRAALGAGRWRLMRQLLAESGVVAILGGGLGLLLAFWAIDLFAVLSPGNIPRLSEVRIDGGVLGFTLLLTLTASVLFGLAPALQCSQTNLVEDLKEGQRGSTGRLGRSLRGALVVSQVSLALVLLVGAGLLAQSFLRMTTAAPGFNPDNLLIVWLAAPMKKYQKPEQVADFYLKVTREFEALPGVTSVGAVSAGPQFKSLETIEFSPAGREASTPGQYPQAHYFDAGPNYFRTMGIPVIKGREFTERDIVGSPSVAVINESMARRYWPDEDPIGKRVDLVRENETMEIVGVVGDVPGYGPDAKVEPEIYWPYLQRTRWATYFAIRSGSDPAILAPAVRPRVAAIDKDVFVSTPRTMDVLISRSLKDPRFNLFVVAVFATAALLLASVGLYAVISYSAAQRTHEIGIRVALGAARRDVLNLIVGEGLKLVLGGLALGLILSFAVTRLIANLLFGTSPTDPAALAGVSVLLLVVALAASFIPARRAAKTDPMTALRHE